MADEVSTPFIDLLSDAQKRIVQQKQRSPRPSYYSSTLAQAAALQGTDLSGNAINPTTQISADTEAVLILAPVAARQSLVKFLQFVLSANANADEAELYGQVVAARQLSYATVNNDVAAPVAQFDNARSAFMREIQQLSHANTDDPTTTLMPDLSVLFSSVFADYTKLANADLLEMHNRIADATFLGDFINVGEKTKELQSWVQVILAYM